MSKKFVISTGKGFGKEYVWEYEGARTRLCGTANEAEKFTEDKASENLDILNKIFCGDIEFRVEPALEKSAGRDGI